MNNLSKSFLRHMSRVSFVVFLIFVLTPSPGLVGTAQPTRIISLIPAVTEILFAIGAGPKVVAVSSFDEYPPEVMSLPRVGALIDPDLERILSLKPDLVAIYHSQVDLQRQLERASVPVFAYKHGGLADVGVTIRELGQRVGHAGNADAVVRRIDIKLGEIKARVGNRPRPSTLLVFGRDALALRGVYASGGIGFMHDMLVAAGGSNVFDDVKQQSVQATSELILARRPEAIVEIRMGKDADKQRDNEIAVWRTLGSVPAVRSKRIAFITDERTVIPGPRVAEGTELIARALHPDAFAK
jgi:iron complex transport system substrate-binding protein